MKAVFIDAVGPSGLLLCISKVVKWFTTSAKALVDNHFLLNSNFKMFFSARNWALNYSTLQDYINAGLVERS